MRGHTGNKADIKCGNAVLSYDSVAMGKAGQRAFSSGVVPSDDAVALGGVIDKEACFAQANSGAFLFCSAMPGEVSEETRVAVCACV